MEIYFFISCVTIWSVFQNPVTFIIFTLFHNHNAVLQLDLLSTKVAVAITFVITFILTLTIAAVITSIITYICVKRKFEKTLQDLKNKQQKTVIYEQVGPSNKNDLELQPNPAYGTSQKVTMDVNPAYASFKEQ